MTELTRRRIVAAAGAIASAGALAPFAPPAQAAAMPDGASSTTRLCAGGTLSAFAANRNSEGSGLPRGTSVPLRSASKIDNSGRPSERLRWLSMAATFFDEDASARFKPARSKASANRTASGKAWKLPSAISRSISALHSSAAVKGVNSDGLITTALPPASAGPTLCANTFSGELNGVIAHTTPRGARIADVAAGPGTLTLLAAKTRDARVSAIDFSENMVAALRARVIERDYSHPCVIAWVPINESWGVPNLPENPRERHYVQALYHITKTLDATRPVTSAAGRTSRVNSTSCGSA